MGVKSFAKNRLWGDYPQYIVDDWLKYFGFNYEKSKEYTDAEIKAFFKRAWNHKIMFTNFVLAFTSETGRKPLKSEYRYHIVFGLGNPKILKIKNKR